MFFPSPHTHVQPTRICVYQFYQPLSLHSLAAFFWNFLSLVPSLLPLWRKQSHLSKQKESFMELMGKMSTPDGVHRETLGVYLKGTSGNSALYTLTERNFLSNQN